MINVEMICEKVSCQANRTSRPIGVIDNECDDIEDEIE